MVERNQTCKCNARDLKLTWWKSKKLSLVKGHLKAQRAHCGGRGRVRPLVENSTNFIFFIFETLPKRHSFYLISLFSVISVSILYIWHVSTICFIYLLAQPWCRSGYSTLRGRGCCLWSWMQQFRLLKLQSLVQDFCVFNILHLLRTFRFNIVSHSTLLLRLSSNDVEVDFKLNSS